MAARVPKKVLYINTTELQCNGSVACLWLYRAMKVIQQTHDLTLYLSQFVFASDNIQGGHNVADEHETPPINTRIDNFESGMHQHTYNNGAVTV